LEGRAVKLDYNPANGNFILSVPRGEADPKMLMEEHGLDVWGASLKTDTALLFTTEPYAAVSFYKYATPAAQKQLIAMNYDIERSWAADHPGTFNIPLDLWPFQKASVAYALHAGDCLVADEPGLGKTPIAICVANEMKAKRVLVVCPASIRYQWLRRIRDWSMMNKQGGYDVPNHNAYAITSSGGGVSDTAGWTVVSWDLLGRAISGGAVDTGAPGLLRALLKGTYDLLILDEAHYAKHPERGRTRAIFGGGRDNPFEPLARRSVHTLALTGTPLPNRPREAYVLARHLCWESIDFLSENDFNERFNPANPVYMRGDKRRVIGVDERVGREGELQNRLRRNFMVRHLKRDVMPQLHYPEYDLVYIEETAAIKAALRAERLLDINPDDLSGADAELLGQISSVRKQMGVAMAPGVGSYVGEVLEGGEPKVTVFAWHTDVVQILMEKLHHYNPVQVTGAETSREKDKRVQRFIDDPSCRVIIGNVLSLGTGTDGLQHVCTRAILGEPDWVHGNNQQCIDRLDRGGQSGQVLADICVVSGSVSERVLAASLRKAAVVEKALDRRVG
jgi:SWI/SNF-related matrix-associated actin-dependent regulator 1 of chromatin subfamily A